jgi:FkbM family methyltransferase
VGQGGRVLAFEACQPLFQCLVANAALNGLSNVTAIHTAVCDIDGDVPFYPVPPGHVRMGALAPQFEATRVTVSGSRLDQLLQHAGLRHADVVKIDVEGFEQKVFEGAMTLIGRKEPPVFIFAFSDEAETRLPGASPGDAQRFLMTQGYTLWRLRDYRRRRAPLIQPVTNGATMVVAKRI